MMSKDLDSASKKIESLQLRLQANNPPQMDELNRPGGSGRRPRQFIVQPRLQANNPMESQMDEFNRPEDIVLRPRQLLPSTPGRERRPLQLPIFQYNQMTGARHEGDIQNKLQKIASGSGQLTIDGKKLETHTSDLQELGELGNGTSGQVIKMRHISSNTYIAVKQMRRTGNDEENKRIIMDIEVVLQSTDCPYIVQCLGYFITDAEVWICMELMATCFDKLLKKSKIPVPEQILGKLTVATVKALSYLKEKHGVIHRDVKPSNILIDEKGNIELCDFGISGRLVDSMAKTRHGCAAYMAPERIDPKKPEYDIRADVWSLGISLIELATNSFPYNGSNDFEVLTKVLDDEPPSLPTNKGFSLEFQDFVKKCLTKNYEHRPKYQELLRQPFYKLYETAEVDVPGWFASIMEKTGLKSHRRHSPLPDKLKQPILSSSSSLSASPSNIPVYKSSANNQQNYDNIHIQRCSPPNTNSISSANILIAQNHSNQQQNFSPRITDAMVRQPSISEQPVNSDTDEVDIVKEMNRMYKLSPFVQRRNDMRDADRKNKKDSIFGNIGQTLKNITNSPFSQRKEFLSQQQDEKREPFRPQHSQLNSPYFNRSNVPASPILSRKTYDSNIPQSEQTQIRVHGNTSPLVVQRFYHQQSQLRDREEEEERNKHQSSNTNPFLSNIPTSETSPPSNETNYQQSTTSPPQSVKPTIATTTSSATQNQFPSPYLIGYETAARQSNIPMFQYTSNPFSSPKHEFLFGKSGGQQIQKTQSVEQTSPPEQKGFNTELKESLNREENIINTLNQQKTGKIAENNKKTSEGSTNVNGNGSGTIKDDTGWFNSLTGVVKRRFASYVKLHLTNNDKDRDHNHRGQEKQRFGCNGAMVAPATTVTVTNSFIPTPTQTIRTVETVPHQLRTALNPQVLNVMDRRHRSPDPPPRYNRGQSPLVLRRNLIEIGQLPPDSPLLTRRNVNASPPLPPPRRFSESVPNSPQHLRTRINYTPEVQRRVYRPSPTEH